MIRTRTTPTTRRARRGAVAAGVAVASLLLFTGCDLFAPQDTLDIRDVTDGASGSVGDVHIANAVLITENKGDPANLVATLVNESNKDQEVSIHAGGASESVSLTGSEVLQLGTSGGQSIVFENLDATPGGLTDITFAGADESTTLQVPVLTGGLQEYRDLVPTQTPTPTSTPGSTSTPEPTPTAKTDESNGG